MGEPKKASGQGHGTRMFEIVLIAMVAAFILLRLRSELGNKTGNEPQPPAAHPAPMRDAGYTIDGESETVDAVADQKIVDLDADPEVRKGLSDIRHADRDFDLTTFLTGAKGAYEMILEAFWNGDRETLRQFLDDDVFKQFSGAIDAREQQGLKMENRLLNITKEKVVQAQLSGSVAELSVQFKSEVIAVTRNADGKVVEGDVSDAVEVNDRWTFARDTKTDDPNWLLIATRAG